MWYSLAKPCPSSSLKPLPKNIKPRDIAVEYHNTPSTLEVESAMVDSVEYLIAALRHFKTAVPLEVEYFDQVRQDYSPLTDVGALNQGDLTKHKLRVKEVGGFLFILLLLLCSCSTTTTL